MRPSSDAYVGSSGSGAQAPAPDAWFATSAIARPPWDVLSLIPARERKQVSTHT